MATVEREGSRVVVSLEPAEAGMLASLVSQVVDLLDSDTAEGPGSSDQAVGTGDPLEELVGLTVAPVAAPRDPALARLLPDAYRDDEEKAAEFRRFTDGDLRAAKRRALAAITDTLDAAHRASGASPAAAPTAGTVTSDEPTGVASDIVLDDEQADAWLQGLNDVRLALGTRLEITEDMDAEVAKATPGSSRWEGLVLYDWLTMLQDALITAVTQT